MGLGHGHWKKYTVIKNDNPQDRKRKIKKSCFRCGNDKNIRQRLKYNEENLGDEIWICDECFEKAIQDGEDISENYNTNYM